MPQAGIQGAKRRGKTWRTTVPDPNATRAADLVERDFSAETTDRRWVCDLTRLRCWDAGPAAPTSSFAQPGECVELGASVTRPVYGREQHVVGSDEAFCAVVRLRLRGDQQQPRSVGQVLKPERRWHWTSLSHRPPDRNVPPSLGSPPDDFQAPAAEPAAR